MAILAWQDFSDRIKILRPTQLMGIDYGDQRIGVAVSDPGWMVASPIGVIQEAKFTKGAEALIRLMEGRRIGGIILGLPVNMDGTEGPRCQILRSYADNLNQFLKQKNQELFITYWDERLSTQAVERFLIGDLDTTRKKRQQKVDQLAATYILEGALARLRNMTVL